MACEDIATINIECVVQNQDYSALLEFFDEDQESVETPIDLTLYPSIFFDVFYRLYAYRQADNWRRPNRYE